MDLSAEGVKRLAVPLGVIIIIAAAVIGAILFLQPKESAIESLSVKVLNESNEPLWKADVKISSIALAGESAGTNKGGVAEFSSLKGLKAGETIEVEVGKEGFEKGNKRVEITGDRQEIEVRLKAVQRQGSEFKISFTDEEGRLLAGTIIEAEFFCTQISSAAIKKATVSNGTITVQAPAGCAALSVKTTASGFEGGNFTVTQKEAVLQLKALRKEKGRALVEVEDSESGQALGGIEVKIFDSLGIEAARKLTSFGEAVFDLEEGEYKIEASDSELRYASEQDSIAVEAKQSTAKKILLSKDVKATLNFSVKDEASGRELSVAVIKVKSAAKEFSLDFPSKKSIALKDFGTYSYAASAEGYALKGFETIEISGPEKGVQKDIEILLSPCTPEKCGNVNVKVLDEEGKAVERAKVVLADADDETTLSSIGMELTDSNGFAEFSSVPDANIYASAQKYYASGKSGTGRPNAAGTTTLNVRLEFGFGSVELKAVDSGGSAIEDVEVEVRGESGKALNLVNLGESGKQSVQLKTDKRYFFVFKKEGYANHSTILYTLQPGKKVSITAAMAAELRGDFPEITLESVKEKNSGENARALQPGKEYVARLLLRAPSQDVEELGLHARVEGEGIAISGVNFSSDSFSGGSSFNPPSNEAEDLAGAEYGSLKWFNTAWNSENAGGVYDAEFSFSISEGVSSGTIEKILFRAWSLGSNGNYYRAPLDTVLGFSRENDSRQELYADAFERVFPVTQSAECSEEFCFNASVEALEGDFAGNEEPFDLGVGKRYELSFEMLNFYGSVQNSALKVSNADNAIKMSDYSVENNGSEIFSGADEAYNFDADAGRFEYGTSLSGTMKLSPVEKKETAIELTLENSGTQIYSKSVRLDSTEKKPLEIEYTPSKIFPYSSQSLALKVLSGKEKVADATISLKTIFPDGTETFESKSTNADGNAFFGVRNLPPRTVLEVTAYKRGFLSKIVRIKVSRSVLFFIPEQLNPAMDIASNLETSEAFDVNSLVPFELRIERAGFSGYFKDLIDEQRTIESLGGLAGQTVSKTSPLSADAGFGLSAEAKKMTRGENLKGTIYFVVSGNSGIWIDSLPVQISIGLYPPLKDGNCVIVSESQWNSSTVEEIASKEFTLKNECFSEDGKEILLPDLLAKVNWASEKVGNVELSIADPEKGLIYSQILKADSFTGFFGDNFFEPGKEYFGTLVFTPNSGVQGKTALFSIEMGASLDADKSNLEALGTNKISSQVSVIDLRQCLTFNPNPQEGIIIDRNDSSASYEMKIGNCGVPINVSFCGNGADECRGGASEGGITVTPWNFSNLKQGDTVDLNVSRIKGGIPGFYGITVDATPSTGGKTLRVAELEAIVMPEPFSPAARGTWFDLDKYEFTLAGKGAQDSAKVTNNMVWEKVDVSATLCEWQKTGKHANWAAKLRNLRILGLKLFKYSIPLRMLSSVTGGGKSCDEIIITQELADYVINLSGKSIINDDQEVDPASGEKLTVPLEDEKPDAIDIGLDIQGVTAKWDLNEVTIEPGDVNNGNGIETVGAIFENIGGPPNKAVAYGIATFNATEHVHGDETHNKGDVFCNNPDFAPYNIGPNSDEGSCDDAYDNIYAQKFHLRFRFSDVEQNIPAIAAGISACSAGGLEGRTGPNVLPKTRLNWNWTQGNAIQWNSCDAGNPDAFYCDATQFTIMMMKRIKMYNDGLAAGDTGTCALTVGDLKDNLDELNEEQSINAVPSGKVGVSLLKTFISGGTATESVEINNNSDSALDEAQVYVTLSDGTDLVDDCTKTVSMLANDYEQVECDFSVSGESVYTAAAMVAFSGGNNEDYSIVKNSFLVTAKNDPECFSSSSYDYVNNIPNTSEELRKLVVFRALLMKDGFGGDFAKDFTDYYAGQAFFDTSTFFTSEGFDKALREGRIIFKRKYEDRQDLPAAGLYDVSIKAKLTQDNRIVGQNGETDGNVIITLKHLDFPSEDSIFYTLPFDGLVGVKGNEFERNGYGIDYENLSERFSLNRGQQPAKTYSAAQDSNALIQAKTVLGESFYELNLDSENRGKIFSVKKPSSEEVEFSFNPAYATPIIAEIAKGASDSNYFSAAFSMRDSADNLLNFGESTGFWSGVGACLDFDAKPLNENFSEKPDAPATEKDAPDFKDKYAFSWNNAALNGNVFLKSVYYTSPSNSIVLKSESSALKFHSPNESLEVVGLNGVSGMAFNDFSAGSAGKIDSVDDVFSMVQSGLVCVKNDGTTSTFFWNPEALENAQGKQQSISAIEAGIVPGQSCIG